MPQDLNSLIGMYGGFMTFAVVGLLAAAYSIIRRPNLGWRKSVSYLLGGFVTAELAGYAAQYFIPTVPVAWLGAAWFGGLCGRLLANTLQDEVGSEVIQKIEERTGLSRKLDRSHKNPAERRSRNDPPPQGERRKRPARPIDPEQFEDSGTRRL